MISYPTLKKEATIGVTAPSSGVPAELHDMFRLAIDRMSSRGFHVVTGDTAWTQDKAKSAPARNRAEEFNEMMRNDKIDIIIPPWGGELLIEVLQGIDFSSVKNKWLLGYSDISALLLAITLKTGIATAHGTNFVDLRGEYWDDTTAKWQNVLSTEPGGTVIQHSSPKFQKQWEHGDPSPCVFHLTEETQWKTVGDEPLKVEGRLLGGCIDILRHLVGTKYGDVAAFRENHLDGEPVLWYLENCDMNATDLRRSLVQMKYAGWFDNCSGILFGRSPANDPVGNYTVEDVYKEMADELGMPVVYDIDCGHMPPQVTFINGAYAVVEAADGKGTVEQRLV
ncbi:LD-carboxypeptidase [Rossellomorea vietnamensis]|uniref:LD-carboxypeptidase n=1 Tax=Rossellomorea vietnamensis TaxID=218284 RepID=A0A5D4MAF7_9BACI|nr:S66 peptidase family protein [Rossellomorea vietnamensis]TYR98616.1 LD-carboxypeptidase [Rossellomorea vietnamensis]